MSHKVKGKWRFSYRPHEIDGKLEVRFRQQTYVVDSVHCECRCESFKTKPLLVMQGWAADVRIVTINAEQVAGIF
jgi:hypothetical protein